MKEKDEKNSEEEEDESELEKEIEELEEEISDEDEIFDEDLIEFIPSTKKISTLNKINISEEVPVDLEENLRKTTHLPDDEEDDSFKYGNKKEEGEESKYQDFNTNYSAELMTTMNDFSKERKNFRNVGFVESAETRISPEKNFERYEAVKRFDKDDFRKSDLERREVKYKPLN